MPPSLEGESDIIAENIAGRYLHGIGPFGLQAENFSVHRNVETPRQPLGCGKGP